MMTIFWARQWVVGVVADWPGAVVGGRHREDKGAFKLKAISSFFNWGVIIIILKAIILSGRKYNFQILPKDQGLLYIRLLFFCKFQIQMIKKSSWTILHFKFFLCLKDILIHDNIFCKWSKRSPFFQRRPVLGFSQKQMTRRPTPPVAENLISVTPESSFFLGTNSWVTVTFWEFWQKLLILIFCSNDDMMQSEVENPVLIPCISFVLLEE